LDQRKDLLARWVTEQLQQSQRYPGNQPLGLDAVSGDASFRRYFRARVGSDTFIAVDAPPETEDSAAFVAIARNWRAAGIPVPEILATDLERGLMLQGDFGDVLYLDRLAAESADSLYRPALSTLIQIQRCQTIEGYRLPLYDREALAREMSLCPDWFLTRLLGLELSDTERAMLQAVFDVIAERAVGQPQVCVHRDYHSRNLMLPAAGGLGVLDFQGAVIGPVTYDLASLLRDCYISWSAARERSWVEAYLELATRSGIMPATPYEEFKQSFDWMGLQRHLKCVGIFSRLYLRDDKPGYLHDIPRTFRYLKLVCARYPEFAVFDQWLDARVIPAMAEHSLLSPWQSVEVVA
jgi:aminoglycoside/choline kinase family phosphotransferase